MTEAPSDHHAAARLISDYPLAWVCHLESGESTPLPLLGSYAADGRLRTLLGHLANRNPLCAALKTGGDVLALFTGPQGYMSPSLVSQPDWGPTWNYAALSVRGTARMLPTVDEALDRLVAHAEAANESPWTSAALGARYDTLAQHISAFEIEVKTVEPRFKLGGEERPEILQELIAGTENAELAEWMLWKNAVQRH